LDKECEAAAQEASRLRACTTPNFRPATTRAVPHRAKKSRPQRLSALISRAARGEASASGAGNSTLSRMCDQDQLVLWRHAHGEIRPVVFYWPFNGALQLWKTMKSPRPSPRPSQGETLAESIPSCRHRNCRLLCCRAVAHNVGLWCCIHARQAEGGEAGLDREGNLAWLQAARDVMPCSLQIQSHCQSLRAPDRTPVSVCGNVYKVPQGVKE